MSDQVHIVCMYTVSVCLSVCLTQKRQLSHSGPTHSHHLHIPTPLRSSPLATCPLSFSSSERHSLIRLLTDGHCHLLPLHSLTRRLLTRHSLIGYSPIPHSSGRMMT